MKNKLRQICRMVVGLSKYLFFLAYVKCRRFDDNAKVWLIAERGDDARDNGYTFYCYMKQYHPEQKIRYVVDEDSPDYHKIAKCDAVQYRSKEHYILFLTAGKLISTHIMGCSPQRGLFWRLDKYGLAKTRGKRIFLQHGITKDYIECMTAKISKLDLFICGGKPEYDYILKSYGHSADVVKYTGFARFDSLGHPQQKYILVMPTWRKWLPYSNDIKSSDYVVSWNTFLNDPVLLEYLKKTKQKLIFYPHYEMQPYLKYFHVSSKLITIASIKDYDVQQLLKDTSLLITDYSSVAFDVAYMNKPLLYYQFDYKEYRKKHYATGYFDYRTMGFGPVAYSEQELIKDLLSNRAKEQKYIARAKKFFPIQDTKNSQRIFEEIKNI